MNPRLLDLFSCAGGAGVGYARAGFEVVGVDIAPQPNYPFEHHVADALEFVAAHGHEFDAIHASPPCQGYLNLTRVNRKLGRDPQHPELIGQTRDALSAAGLPWVIENVPDAKAALNDPVRVCGTAFGLPLRRHRLFESNVPIVGIACDHKRFNEPRYWTSWRPNGQHRLSTVVQVYGNGGNQHEWAAAMGIDWATNAEIAEAIPPAYTEFIGAQLLASIAKELAA